MVSILVEIVTVVLDIEPTSSRLVGASLVLVGGWVRKWLWTIAFRLLMICTVSNMVVVGLVSTCVTPLGRYWLLRLYRKIGMLLL